MYRFLYQPSDKSDYNRPIITPTDITHKENGKIKQYKDRVPTGDADEWIEQFKTLTKTQAREKYFELHDSGIFLPDKAYVFLTKKRNGEVYFDDSEFNKRQSIGKATAYVFPIDIYYEKAIEIFSSYTLDFSEKTLQFAEITKTQKVKNKTQNHFHIYCLLVDKLIADNPISKDNIDFIKSEKRRLSTAITKGNITFKDIPFSNIDKLFKDIPPDFISFTSKDKVEKSNKKHH